MFGLVQNREDWTTRTYGYLDGEHDNKHWDPTIFWDNSQTYPCGRIFLRKLLLLLINNLVEPRLFSKKCCTSGTKNHIFWQKRGTLSINTALFHETRCFLMLKFCIFWTKLGLVQERSLFSTELHTLLLADGRKGTAGNFLLGWVWADIQRYYPIYVCTSLCIPCIHSWIPICINMHVYFIIYIVIKNYAHA